MIIAFEGPDKTGKSTSAAALSSNHTPFYNARKDTYESLREDLKNEAEVVQTFDRIDWFSHMIYRLALPDHEWNDERVRTVFSMPDTHLVVKLHDSQTVANVQDELYELGTLTKVNQAYREGVMFLEDLNQRLDFQLFKSISTMEVFHDPKAGVFQQHMMTFMSASSQWDRPKGFPEEQRRRHKNGETNEQLLELLRKADQNLLEWTKRPNESY